MKRISQLSDQFNAEWARAKPLLQPALDRQDRHGYTLADIYDMLSAGQCHLWTDNHSAAVTHVSVHPRGRICVIWLAGGELPEIIAGIEDPQNLAWARSIGCVAVEVHGRTGWTKALRQSGFEARSVSYVKLLEKVDG